MQQKCYRMQEKKCLKSIGLSQKAWRVNRRRTGLKALLKASHAEEVSNSLFWL